MKVLGWFEVFPSEVSKALLKHLLAVHPEGTRLTLPSLDGVRTEYFWCELPKDDPKLQELINVLTQHGYKLWRGRSAKKPEDVLFEYRRKYETSDFEAAELLQPQPKLCIGTAGRNEEGLLLLDPKPKFVKRDGSGLHGFEIGFNICISLIVSDALRQKFESSGLRHLLFKPVMMEENPAMGPISGYWELTSDYLMPPLANPELDEGFYTPVEFHYRASDLRKAEAFDFALTRENLLENWRYPVVSQRFYQFCVAQKLDMTWEPVRVDPD